MANQVRQRRAKAIKLIDDFIEINCDQILEYLQLENNVHSLVHAINHLTFIYNLITHPALVAGAVAAETAQQVEQARDVARESVNIMRNMVPQVINYLNGENSLHNLHLAIDILTEINNLITNEALFPPPGN